MSHHCHGISLRRNLYARLLPSVIAICIRVGETDSALSHAWKSIARI